MLSREPHPKPSPARMLEILTDRFAAFEAVANSTIKLARAAPEPELAMDLLMADAVLQFGSDLREARDAASAWCRARRPA
jgi:hypothetical protein